MPRKPSSEEVTQAKLQLMDEIERGELSLGQAVRRMRLITGKTRRILPKISLAFRRAFLQK